MAEEELTSERIKRLLQEAVQEKEQCGFAAYIVAKNDPKIRKMILDEGKISEDNNYKKKVRDVLLDVIAEKYLPDDVKYVSGSQVADDQRKYYIIKQSDEYRPFDYLKNDMSNIQEFKFEQIDEASGLIFWFRINGKEFWAYQHLWSIMVPNKKKNNLMSRIHKYENHDCFAEQKEPLVTIANKIDLLVIEDYVITSNISLMQKSFGFQDFIRATANRTIEKVTQKQLVANPEKLSEYIERGKTTKYAKKVMRIADSEVLGLPNENLMEKVHTLDRWKDKFEENEEGLIVLNTYAQVENMIDLLDERYTRSDVTNREYDTDVKQLATPV